MEDNGSMILIGFIAVGLSAGVVGLTFGWFLRWWLYW
jgi:hypothetical protein